MDMSDAHNMASVGSAAVSAGSAAAKHTAIAAGGGLAMGAVVVMSLTMPSRKIDFFAALISTVISSLCGGAYAVQHFDLLAGVILAPTTAHLYLALAQIGGVFFVCGLPGWVLVRSVFVFTETRKTKGIDVLVGDAKRIWKNED